MPKRVKPKYTSDAVQAVPHFDFGLALPELLKICQVRDPSHLTADLTRIARDYRWQRDQQSRAPSAARQNAVWNDLANQCGELAGKLQSLPLEVEYAFRVAICSPHDHQDEILKLASVLDELAAVARNHLKSGKSITGPRPLRALQLAVARLANAWELATGTRFTHNPKTKTEYSGIPNSPAGQFVVTFFATVDPKISPNKISTAMAYHVGLRSRSNSKKPGLNRE
jgi:hypothetical protein